jgi:outer membrane autotransporter protein
MLQPGRYIGASVNYSDSSLTYRDQSAGDTAHIKSTQLLLYATQDIGAFYIDGIAAFGWQKYDGTRNGGLAGVSAGAYDGRTWSFRVGGGMPIALSSRASITPQVRLDWDNIKQDAYSETGGDPLSLSVTSRTADRFRGSIGGQLDFASGRGDVKVRPFLRGFWHHNFSNNGMDASASFVSGSASFITPGQKLEREPYTLGAGINFYGSRAFSAALTYDGTFSDSYHSHVYEAKARWTF